MNKIERINQLLASSAHLRKQLEAVTHEFVELHGYQQNSREAYQLSDVCWFGVDYEEVIHEILELKKLQRKLK